jgi:hypothetical protein
MGTEVKGRKVSLKDRALCCYGYYTFLPSIFFADSKKYQQLGVYHVLLDKKLN